MLAPSASYRVALRLTFEIRSELTPLQILLLPTGLASVRCEVEDDPGGGGYYDAGRRPLEACSLQALALGLRLVRARRKAALRMKSLTFSPRVLAAAVISE